MGAGGAKLSKTEQQLVDQKKYIREGLLNMDIRYGDKVRIYKQINSPQRVAIIQKVFDTEIQYQATLDIQKILAKLKHPALIQLLNIVTKKKEQLCSKFYKMKFLYEYIDNDLQKDMEQRRLFENEVKQIPINQLLQIDEFKQMNNQVSLSASYKVYYEESELWYIIASVVAVIAYLQERNLIHGDIRPFNLCLTTDNVLKVMTINSYIQTNWSSYMEKLEKLDTVSTYISPIQLGALQHNVNRPIHNVPKSDIFTLGVIILELCLLESAQDIYDFSSYSIDLTTRIKRIKDLNKYSDHFIDTLILMLKLQESDRPSPTELYNIIAQLAKTQEISISNRLFSLERIQLAVNKWKQKNPNYLYPQQQYGVQQQTQQQFQQQQFQLQYPQQGQQLNDNNETEEELPNQDDGEVINDLGLLNKNENKNNLSNSFSIQKSGQNLSHAKINSEDGNKNNLSVQSGGGNNGGQLNDSMSRIRRNLSGDFKQNDNKENQQQIKGIIPSQESQTQIKQQQYSRNLSQPILPGVNLPIGGNNILNSNNNNKSFTGFDQNQNHNNISVSGLQRNQSQHFQVPNNVGQNLGNTSSRFLMGVSQNNNNINNLGQPQQQQQQQFNQFGQMNMQQNSFGGVNFQNQNNQNNSLFGMQNFIPNNNNNNNMNNNQYNSFNQNMNYNSGNSQNDQLMQFAALLSQKNMNNNSNQMNPQMIQAILSDPQWSQAFIQFQQQQQTNFNSNNNNQQNNPMFLNNMNQFNNNNGNQSQLSPTFNAQQQQNNFSMNRAGGFSLNNQNSQTNLNQNNSFYNANSTNNNNMGYSVNQQNNNQFGNQQQNNQFQNIFQNSNNQISTNSQNLFTNNNNNNNTFTNQNQNQNNNNSVFYQNNNNNQNQPATANIFGKMNSLGGVQNQNGNGNLTQNQIPLQNNQNLNGAIQQQQQQQQQQPSAQNIFSRNKSIF